LERNISPGSSELYEAAKIKIVLMRSVERGRAQEFILSTPEQQSTECAIPYPQSVFVQSVYLKYGLRLFAGCGCAGMLYSFLPCLAAPR